MTAIDLRAADAQAPPFALLERIAGSLWFAVLAIIFARGLSQTLQAIPPGSASLVDWAPALTRCCTLVFYATLGWLVMVRPPSLARRNGPIPMAAAFAGTYAVWLLPLLPSGGTSAVLQTVSAAIALLGSGLIILAVLYLGKSFSIAPQARRLVIKGPYRLVRHPLYAAEEIAIIGVLLQYAWYAALGFLVVHIALQIRRMDYEESLLMSVFPDYEDYARRTARLIPGVW
jgi:protein-S-isoprenylcysteine O-methyltransferase Ste14